ncbi:hypothetical protein [Aurantiacibacter odishensis]|uniref:hypothetical protein n=1 Tax=Aurantiacibacter odishensis TaxID=1155476 RepID=UPI000E730970|nr:hypothetical protein [Aurantiacibacter odishensis]
MKLFSHLRFAAALLLSSTITACATVPDAPIVSNGPAASAGTAVPLGKPVMAGNLVATPMEIHEDSRCPANARCVWAGRVIVLTRIDGAGWRETAYLTLGEPYATHGARLTLTSASPTAMTGEVIAPEDYRFTYSASE